MNAVQVLLDFYNLKTFVDGRTKNRKRIIKSDNLIFEGTQIKYNESEIGIQWCSNQVVSDGIITMEYGEAGSNLAYPKGIKVWSHKSNAWATIDIPWISDVIGWVEEE